MKLFDKLFKKYKKEPEDNVPEFLYGVANYDNKKKENKEKYNVEPGDNNPTKLYGIRRPMDEGDLEIKPEDNVPQMLYGIPDSILKAQEAKPLNNNPTNQEEENKDEIA